MSIDQLLDQILIPRPNGSEGLAQVAAFIETTLRDHTPEVELHTFTATPYGFQLLMATALVFMLAFVAAIARGRYGIATFLSAIVPMILVLETEWLWSPVSGLLPLEEDNIVGVFPGHVQGPTLVLCAHYDTATQFGDHITWARWMPIVGLAVALALALSLSGLWQRRWGRELPRMLRLSVAGFVLVPFGAMAVFFSAGPLVRTPSLGALDNGGSVAVLLRLAERPTLRPADAPTTVKLVFLAAEEERALGSWHYANMLREKQSVGVINLEIVGASNQLAYVLEEGFALRRYHPSDSLVDLVRKTAQKMWGQPLAARRLPGAMYTDGRSFLAQGIAAVTLMSVYEGGPRGLHSARDSRDRLLVPQLERTVELLAAIVASMDRDPLILRTR